jgi:hypothetical protein
LAAIWSFAALFALARWLVVYPTILSLIGAILVIDHMFTLPFEHKGWQVGDGRVH